MNHTNAREVAALAARIIAPISQPFTVSENPIFKDDEAMKLIRLLQDKGYEADEVFNAMEVTE